MNKIAAYSFSAMAALWLLTAGRPAVSENKMSTQPAACVLNPDDFKHYVDDFNAADVAGQSTSSSIPDAKAWDFLRTNIPWFECPDKQFEQTYYFRWWTYRKHLKLTPTGWIVTEFLPDVPWAGKYNSISCAAGHHLYEGRWLRDRRYMEDYAGFWFQEGASPRNYSFWAADSVHAVTMVTGDERLSRELLPALIANYQEWEKTNQDSTGLFRQVDDRDGMEYSLGGSGYRPTINAYMYGDAVAIASMAASAGMTSTAAEYREKAARIKWLVQTYLWNPSDHFFETAPETSDLSKLKTCGVREEIGFVPWYFNLPDAGYESAWRQLDDPQGFRAPYGPTTAERRAAGFMHPENHDCLWNGPSWPYATTQVLVAMANLLDNYPPGVVTKSDYLRLIETYARSQQKDGHPWIAEDLDADSGKWIVDLPRSVYYNHSGFVDPVITGLVGLRPRDDDRIELKPLVPAETWPWFCLDGICYHDHELTILWDSTGDRYKKGSGLTLFVDGKRVAHRPDLGDLSALLKLVARPDLTIRRTGRDAHPTIRCNPGIIAYLPNTPKL